MTLIIMIKTCKESGMGGWRRNRVDIVKYTYIPIYTVRLYILYVR